MARTLTIRRYVKDESSSRLDGMQTHVDGRITSGHDVPHFPFVIPGLDPGIHDPDVDDSP
jgi:hypothetical protein